MVEPFIPREPGTLRTAIGGLFEEGMARDRWLWVECDHGLTQFDLDELPEDHRPPAEHRVLDAAVAVHRRRYSACHCGYHG